MLTIRATTHTVLPIDNNNNNNNYYYYFGDGGNYDDVSDVDEI